MSLGERHSWHPEILEAPKPTKVCMGSIVDSKPYSSKL